jgi:hypothetical protein
MSNRTHVLVALAFSALASFGFGCANTQTTTPFAPKSEVTNVAAKDGVKKDDGKKAEEIAILREKLAAHRKQQLERLEAYAAAGQFPLNVTDPEPSHQLKDVNGTYCAVASLVVKDGLQDVIDAESKTHNDLLFGDVKDGQLYSWILTSGLTQEEIAAIQAPAPYVGEGEINMPMPAPQPIDPPKQTAATEQLQAHFRAVEQQIIANTDASLDLAANRLEGTFGSVAVSLL